MFDYAAQTDFPIVGSGLGNANLLFTQWLGTDVVASFLNLYVNILYALGPVGLWLLAMLLAAPLFTSTRQAKARELFPLIAAYLAWLLIFVDAVAELPVIFGVTYALVSHRPNESDAEQHVSSSPRITNPAAR